MPQMLGDRLLPDAVNVRRRKLRNKVQDLRRPLRRRREDMVPGPDVIGKVENQLMDLRDRVMSRDSVMSNIRSRSSSNGQTKDIQQGQSAGSSASTGTASQASNTIT